MAQNFKRKRGDDGDDAPGGKRAKNVQTQSAQVAAARERFVQLKEREAEALRVIEAAKAVLTAHYFTDAEVEGLVEKVIAKPAPPVEMPVRDKQPPQDKPPRKEPQPSNPKEECCPEMFWASENFTCKDRDSCPYLHEFRDTLLRFGKFKQVMTGGKMPQALLDQANGAKARQKQLKRAAAAQRAADAQASSESEADDGKK